MNKDALTEQQERVARARARYSFGCYLNLLCGPQEIEALIGAIAEDIRAERAQDVVTNGNPGYLLLNQDLRGAFARALMARNPVDPLPKEEGADAE